MLPLGLSVSAKDNVAKKSVFEYEKEKNEETGDPIIYITGLKEEVEGELIIPKKISGAKVAYIDKEAFAGCDKLTSIILPPYISVIDEEAFKDCTNLEEITIPDGVITIEDSAFENCSKLETIYTYSGYAVFNDGPYWSGKDVFKGCDSLKTIEFPVQVDGIDDDIFSDCINLEKLYFPRNTTLSSVDDGAFEDCEKLSEIYFDASFPPEFDEDAISTDITLYFSGDYADDWEIVEDAGYELKIYDMPYDPGPECYQDESPVGLIIAGVCVAVAAAGAIVFMKLKKKK